MKKKVVRAIISLQAHVRRRIARHVFQKRLTNQAYRKNVVQEIVKTEEIYLSNLEVLTRVCHISRSLFFFRDFTQIF